MSYNLLKGKRGIIFGALDNKSIAWKVAEKAFEEGAVFTLTNTPIAIRFGQINDLAKACNAQVIPADATSIDDLEMVFRKSMELLGGKIDFVLHSIGMSMNVRKSREYDDLDYEYYHKTIDISAMSFHKMLQVAKKLDAITEWGSVVALSYIAAQRTLYRYNDMADAKAMLESIARQFWIHLRKGEATSRVNTISQSPTLYDRRERRSADRRPARFHRHSMSPLGNATAGVSAPDFCMVLFSDLSKKITMQNIFHDGGFSSMGMSLRAMTQYNKCLDGEE
ncbi:MAG: SDR family oxidoreductase [Sphingobacterium sp.]|nr:SDR family oxidoreductase [Sphingobacterium sp.]